MQYSYIVRLVEAIKKVTEIQKKRQSTYVMQRLRKGREVEQRRDIREVQRDMALIRSPAAGTMHFFFNHYLINFNINILFYKYIGIFDFIIAEKNKLLMNIVKYPFYEILGQKLNCNLEKFLIS